VIARPFTGEPGAFVRRPERRDFSVPPPGPTLLDRCVEHGVAVYGVGKIQDIFAQQGTDRGPVLGLERPRGRTSRSTSCADPALRLVFGNLVDFDSKYGHRNDPRATRTRSRPSTRGSPSSWMRWMAACCC
jgi:phosphopentomutase